MISAVDSCVILDVLNDDPAHANRSIAALKLARSEGRLIVCELVIAEIEPVVGEELSDLIADFGLDFIACGFESAADAGRGFGSYLRRGGKRGRIVADFLIAAHASRHADRLLTRDLGFQRDYFENLSLWYP